jgi:hypothetical protein
MAQKAFVNSAQTMAAFEQATSLAVVDNVYQGEVFFEGKAYTGRYASEATTEINGLLGLDIMRVKMWDDVSRKLDPSGTLPNSNLYNTNATISGAIQVNNQIYTLMLDEVIDHPVFVPRLSLNINHLQQIEHFATNYALNITKTINTSRLAHYLYSLINSVTDSTSLSTNIFNYDPSQIGSATNINGNNVAYQTFMAMLDSFLNGDIKNGFQTFDMERTQLVVRPQGKTDIGVANLNNASDIAVKLLANGTSNPFDATKEVKVDLPTGRFGLVNGVLASYLTNDVWNSAIKYFGDVAASGTTPLPPTATMKIVNAIVGLGMAADACFVGRVSQGTEAGIDPFTRAHVLVPQERIGMTIISPYAVKAVTRLAPASVLAVNDFTTAQAETSELINPASQANFQVVYN